MSNIPEIKPCDKIVDFEHSAKYKKAKLTESQKMRISQLLQYVPQAEASVTMYNAFIAKYPYGFGKANMTPFKDGNGVDATLRDANKKFAGKAHLFQLDEISAELMVFTILSVATGQYYLSRIDNRLSLVSSKLDDVLAFLYGENRAELLAEIYFVKRAHENYASIMERDHQRQATIESLQSAQKTAVKDLEFYLSDMERSANKPAADFRTLLANETAAWRTINCVELALQTLVIASVLEIYFSENFEPEFTEYIRSTLISYINRVDAVVVSSFSTLNARILNYKQKPFEDATDRMKYVGYIKKTLAPYVGETDYPVRSMLESTLNALKEPTTCYITLNGEVYVENN